MNEKILILAGPTSVGKTSLSIKLAKHMNGEIISADSMQIYRYMDIGSAKITSDEMCGITHHLIDICDPKDTFNVALYVNLAKDVIKNITSRGKLPIIVGGTGLYIRSLIYDQKHCTSTEDKEYREYLYDLAKKQGNQYVHNLLLEIDYPSYKNIHYNNLKRVVRALEVYHITNKPFSYFKQDEKPIFNFKYYTLTFDDRQILYNNINTRVDKMIKQGLVDEVINLRKLRYTKDLQSMQGIGYKEIFDYLDGIITLDMAIDKIKQNSRNYAKRQLTWFRKEKNNLFIPKDGKNEDDILNFIVNDFNRSY